MAAAVLGYLHWTKPGHRSTPPGVLVVGQSAELKSLDPHVVTSLNDFRVLANIYDGLVRFAPGTLDLSPALAERWEISGDGKTYTFELRRNVRFHDGSAFDAAAVKYNFDRLLDDAHPAHDTGPFPLAFFFEPIRETEVVGPHRVRFHLKRRFAPFLSNLAYPTGFIVSPAELGRLGKAFGRRPSGTGPFRFASWQTGIKLRLERNPSYWRAPAPLRTVIFRPLKDANTRVAEFLAGGVDLIVEVPSDVTAVLQQQSAVQVLQETGPHLWFLILNTRHGAFRDRRVRQAVNLAIDRKGLVEQVLQGSATIAGGPVPSAFAWADNPQVSAYPHDPDRARQLLREAGWTGEKLVFLAAEGGSGMLEPIAMATAIQADLAAIGIEVEIRTFEWNAYLDRVNDGLGTDADMAEMAWMTNDPDTLPYLALRSDAVPENGGFNSGYYSNPRVDELIEAARETTERAERGRIYRELESIVHEDAPWAIVASWRQSVAARRSVRNLRLEPSFLLDLGSVAKSE